MLADALERSGCSGSNTKETRVQLIFWIKDGKN